MSSTDRPAAPAQEEPTRGKAALGATLRRLQHHEDGALLDDALQRLVEVCVTVFPAAGSGIMLTDEHGELRYVVASDRPAQALEDAQLRTATGPCVDAWLADEAVATADVQTDERWPQVHPHLLDSDVRAVLSVPLHIAGLAVGSLDAYRSEAAEWSGDEAGALGRFAGVVETMIRAAVAADDAGAVVVQLRHALEHRVLVERAIGYLMARESVSARDAFDRLRAQARQQRRKVADTAADVLGSAREKDRR